MSSLNPTVKRLAMIWTLGALAAMSGCDNGDDDPPAPAPAPPPPAPAVAIVASPAAVQLGSASTISWSSSNATSCTASGAWTGAKATSGTEGATPQAAGDASYSLTCTGDGGTASSATTVTVSAGPPAVPTATLTPGSSTVMVGSSTTLTWSSTGATGCTASDAWSGAKSASGTQTVTPAALGASNYILTCTGAGGSIVASATVNAIAAGDLLLTANDNGYVSVYKLDGSTGVPTEVGGSPFPAGGRTASIALSVGNRFAYAANSTTLDISAYNVDAVTGALTAIAGSPFYTSSFPSGIAVHPSGAFVYVLASDGLYKYAVNSAAGALTNVGVAAPAADAVAINPSGDLLYATGVGGVFAYAIDGIGALTAVAGSPFAAGTSTPVDIVVDPAGKFAYAASPFASSVYAYSISAATGALTQVAGSPYYTAVGPGPDNRTTLGPRRLAIDPQGAFLYVSCIGNITNFGGLLGYSINSSTGGLTQVPGSPFHTDYSMALGIDRTGKFAYEVGWAASYGTPKFRSYAIGLTGSLTEIPGGRLTIEGGSRAVALTR